MRGTKYEGIEGLSGREPVDAVLTVGTKSASGAPTMTDRYFIKQPFQTSVDGKLQREEHPAFAAFNSADPKKRQSISGTLVHRDRASLFESYLSAQVLPGHAQHPKKIPACTGDGIRATRYMGKNADDTDRFDEIECPNELCVYRQGAKKACKPSLRFLFRLNWREGINLPRTLVKFTSHSWNTARNFRGFFDYIEEQARGFGLADYSLFGLPFVLNLTSKTDPDKKSRFPVVTIAPSFDLAEFFFRQREQMRQLASDAPAALLPASLEDDDSETVAADFAEIVPGHPISKPSESDVIDAEPERPAGLLSTSALHRIEQAAEAKGFTMADVSAMIGGDVNEAPQSTELEILRSIQERKATKK